MNEDLKMEETAQSIGEVEIVEKDHSYKAPPLPEESKPPTPAELAKMRQIYMRKKREDIELLELEVKYLELLNRHNTLSAIMSAKQDESTK